MLTARGSTNGRTVGALAQGRVGFGLTRLRSRTEAASDLVRGSLSAPPRYEPPPSLVNQTPSFRVSMLWMLVVKSGYASPIHSERPAVHWPGLDLKSLSAEKRKDLPRHLTWASYHRPQTAARNKSIPLNDVIRTLTRLDFVEKRNYSGRWITRLMGR